MYGRAHDFDELFKRGSPTVNFVRIEHGVCRHIAHTVRQLLLLRPTSIGTVKSVPFGTNVTFTATVRPIGPTLARAKVTFEFWRYIGGHWQFLTKRDAYADATGRASWSWTFSWRGQWYVRAIANPTLTNANSVWSAVERYSVF